MKKRIISAAIMIAICIPLIILGGLPFKIGIGVVTILAFKEILELKGIKKYPKGVIILGLVSILLLTFSTKDILFYALGLNFKYLMGVLILMLLPVIFYYNKGKYSYKDAFELLGIIIFLGSIFNLLLNICLHDKPYFYLILIITVMTDTFAYFTGMSIGKHKVTKISPKKSLEGYIGGTIMGTIIAAIYYMTFIGAAPLPKLIPILLFLSIMGQLGDLFYSVIKREKNIKDFSNLIPGHGGVLDRIDSLTFVVIAYVLVNGII